jgi:exopolyphosphatase/pppGpp-phosphohydrolase
VSMFNGWCKIFFASVYGFGLSVKKTFLADLGGGSLEISLLKSGKSPSGKNGNYQYSIDIGSLRLRKMINTEN